MYQLINALLFIAYILLAYRFARFLITPTKFTKKDLYDLAKYANIRGRSKMTKAQLQTAINNTPIRELI